MTTASAAVATARPVTGLRRTCRRTVKRAQRGCRWRRSFGVGGDSVRGELAPTVVTSGRSSRGGPGADVRLERGGRVRRTDELFVGYERPRSRSSRGVMSSTRSLDVGAPRIATRARRLRERGRSGSSLRRTTSEKMGPRELFEHVRARRRPTREVAAERSQARPAVCLRAARPIPERSAPTTSLARTATARRRSQRHSSNRRGAGGACTMVHGQ